MNKKIYLYLVFFIANGYGNINDFSMQLLEEDNCIEKNYIPNIQSLFVLPNDPFVGVGRFHTVEANEVIVHHNVLIENNLILDNNLIVNGNTILGDQDSDTTDIRGIVSINTVGAGSTSVGNSTDAGSFIVRCSPLNSIIFTTGDGVSALSNNGSISFVLNGLNVAPGVPAPNSFNVAMADSEMNFIHFNSIDHDGINGQVHRILVLAQPGVKGGDIFVGAQTDSINQGGQIQIATFTGDSNNVLGGGISLSTGCGNGTGSKTGDINFSTGANNSDNQMSGNINISTGSGDGNSSTAGNINCNISGGNGANQQIGSYSFNCYLGDGNNHQGGNFSINLGAGNGLGSQGGGINVSLSAGNGDSNTAGNINYNISGGNGINQQIGSYNFNSYLGDGDTHQGGNFNVNLNAGNGLGGQGGGINMSTFAGNGDTSTAGSINCNISGGNGITQQIGSYNLNTYLGDGNNNQGGHFNINLTAGNGLNAVGGNFTLNLNGNSNSDNTGGGQVTFNLSAGNSNNSPGGNFNINMNGGNGQSCYGGNININLNAGNGTNASGGSFFVTTNPGADGGSYGGDIKFVTNSNGIANTGKIILQGNSTDPDAIQLEGNILLNLTNQSLKISNIPLATTTLLYIDNNGIVSKDASSKRYKQDIEDLVVDELGLLQSIPHEKTFKFISRPDIPCIGYIAEDFDEQEDSVLKGIVNYNSEGLPESLKYRDLFVIAVAALKKLHQRVLELESVVYNLKS